ncbi:MAG: hypothetical protein B7X57_11070, partial [Erythrobacter sp. 34-65-8]
MMKFLDERLGALSFDPLAFAQSDAKSQLATLLSLVELPFDPSELAAQRKQLYDTRTDVGRSLKEAEGMLASLAEVPEDTPLEEVSLASVLEQKENHDAWVSRAIDSQTRARFARERLDAAKMALEDAKAEFDAATFDLEEATDAILLAPEPVDFSAILRDLESTNEAVRLRLERERVGT